MKRTCKLLIVALLCLALMIPFVSVLPASADTPAHDTTLIGYQLTEPNNSLRSIRLVASGNAATHQKVGFRVSVVGDTRSWDCSSDQVYQSISAKDAAGNTFEAANAADKGAAYLYTMTIKNAPSDKELTLKVQTYAITASGEELLGAEETVTIPAATVDPQKLVVKVKDSTGAVLETYETTGAATVKTLTVKVGDVVTFEGAASPENSNVTAVTYTPYSLTSCSFNATTKELTALTPDTVGGVVVKLGDGSKFKLTVKITVTE